MAWRFGGIAEYTSSSSTSRGVESVSAEHLENLSPVNCSVKFLISTATGNTYLLLFASILKALWILLLKIDPTSFATE